MDYLTLAYLHLGAIIPSFMMGTFLMLRQKGTPLHRQLGQCYVILMMLSAFISLFMEARVGVKVLNHFGPIHVLSVLTLILLPVSVIAIRKGNLRLHKRIMKGVYIGGILIAGAFTFMPGRLMHQWFIL